MQLIFGSPVVLLWRVAWVHQGITLRTIFVIQYCSWGFQTLACNTNKHRQQATATSGSQWQRCKTGIVTDPTQWKIQDWNCDWPYTVKDSRLELWLTLHSERFKTGIVYTVKDAQKHTGSVKECSRRPDNVQTTRLHTTEINDTIDSFCTDKLA